MRVCDHCMLEVSDRDAIHDAIDGQDHVFCCRGCSGIYKLIRSEGLDDFYSRRTDWSPGPANTVATDVASFVEGLRPIGSEIETDIVIDGIRCASCVWLNEKILLRTNGISFAAVNYATHRARVRWDPARTDIRAIIERIRSIGYTPKPFHQSLADEEQQRFSRDLLVRFGTAAFFSMQLMLFSVALYAGYFQGIDDRTRFLFHLISLALTTPVLFYAGWPILSGALRGLRHGAFNMDVLIASGALAAYGYSIAQIPANGEVYFDTAAMIITLILLGRYIEAGARTRASEAITHLLQLRPREARRLELAQADHVDASAMNAASRSMALLTSIRPGDLLEVLPGEKVPLDGIVLSGSSETDESMLTGESHPSAIKKSSTVYGGTLNLYGSFIFRVKSTGNETMLGKIIQAVEDAQSRRAPIQSFADRVVGFFVPSIMAISLATFLGWIFFGASMSQAVMNAISVLVIACPCALGLATPLAILIGTSHAASRGVLIKGGDVIEKAASIDHIVLDKTGTVTEGRSVLAEYRGIGISDPEALLLAASIERRSEHTVGKAIVAAAGNIQLHDVTDFSAIPGQGVRGVINGQSVSVGNRDFVHQELSLAGNTDISPDIARMIETHEQAGSTIVFLGSDNRLFGVFAVADKVREEAMNAVDQLRAQHLGITLLTGDADNAARSVAQRIGITDVRSRVLPLGKAEAVRALQQQGKRVLMVGDGINDAPALIEARVGAAMGRATDIALESADIVIMRPDLRLVAHAALLTKKTFRVIRQNIFWAFFYNLVAVPLAIFGLLHPIVAAASMAISSLSVVGNSLRARVR